MVAINVNGSTLDAEAAPDTPLLCVLRDTLGLTGTKFGCRMALCGACTVQRAWIALDVPQCGYCQSGQIMSAAALLAQKPAPTDADIDAAMSGNICRP